MVQFATFLLSTVLAASYAQGTQAYQVKRATSALDTFGPFKLYSASAGADGTSLINVVQLTTDDNNNTISTLTPCDTCGTTPLYWTLKNSILSPVFNLTGPSNPSIETINLDLPYGKVDVITGPKKQLTPAPIYSVQKNATTKNYVLSANGHSNLFSVCSYIGTRGPAHRRDIYYNQTSTGIANNCASTSLVVKLI